MPTPSSLDDDVPASAAVDDDEPEVVASIEPDEDPDVGDEPVVAGAVDPPLLASGAGTASAGAHATATTTAADAVPNARTETRRRSYQGVAADVGAHSAMHRPISSRPGGMSTSFHVRHWVAGSGHVDGSRRSQNSVQHSAAAQAG